MPKSMTRSWRNSSAGMKAVKAGDPMDESTDMGPLSSEEQRRTVLESARRDCQSAGATLLFGGEALRGRGGIYGGRCAGRRAAGRQGSRTRNFSDRSRWSSRRRISRTRSVSPTTCRSGWDRACGRRDAAEQERFARDIEAGMTAINQLLASAPEAPFGGVKRSGHGRELAPFGLHEFMNLKTVVE